MGVIDQLFLYRHNSLASFVIANAAACAHDRGVACTAAAAWAVNSRPANGGRHGHSLLLHRYYTAARRRRAGSRATSRSTPTSPSTPPPPRAWSPSPSTPRPPPSSPWPPPSSPSSPSLLLLPPHSESTTLYFYTTLSKRRD